MSAAATSSRATVGKSFWPTWSRAVQPARRLGVSSRRSERREKSPSTMGGPIVVTGAAGFIGCNCVAALNARGIDNLLLVDRLGNDEKWRNLIGLRFEDL